MHRKGVAQYLVAMSSLPPNLSLENTVEHLGAACVWVQVRSLSLLIDPSHHLESEEDGSKIF